MERFYWGWRDPDTNTAHVRVGDGGHKAEMLPLRLDLDNHSPTGFEWGYGGSGPAQLALAILADVLDDDARALGLHQAFKWRVIAGLNRTARWYLTRRMVLDHVAAIEREQALRLVP